jgi:hypothetical protein
MSSEHPPETRALSGSDVLIREYRDNDRKAVRAIALETAMRGQGASIYFDDPELLADHLCGYYTDREPLDSLVAERDGQVVGYLFGCRDSAALERYQVRIQAPRLLAAALSRLVTGAYTSRPQNRRFLSWLILRAARERPDFPYRRLPAHYHCNLLSAAQGFRLYTSMTLRFLDRIESAGVTGIHAAVTEPARRGAFHRMAFAFLKTHPSIPFAFSESPSSMSRFVLRDEVPMVNRVWGGEIARYREFVQWIRERYRI